MAICVCKYPLIITDKRDGEEKVFISLPIEVIRDDNIPIPDMEVVDEKDSDDKTKKWMRVIWNKPSNMAKAKKYYNIGGDHIVIAGCPEEQLTCDTKDIHIVYHPIDEWNSYHMPELK